MSSLHDLAVAAEDQKRPLLSGPGRLLDDTIDRHFRGPAKNRKDGPVRPQGDRIVAPQTGRHHEAINIQNFGQLTAVETDLLRPAFPALLRKINNQS